MQIRKTYTGKLGGLQDDLAICLCVSATYPPTPLFYTPQH